MSAMVVMMRILGFAVPSESQEAQRTPALHGSSRFEGFSNHPTPPFVVALNSLLHESYAQTGTGQSPADPIPPNIKREFDRLTLPQKIEFVTFRSRLEHPAGSRWIRATAMGQHSGIEGVLAKMLANEPSDEFVFALIQVTRMLSISPGLRADPSLVKQLRYRASKLPQSVQSLAESEVEQIVSEVKR